MVDTLNQFKNSLARVLKSSKDKFCKQIRMLCFNLEVDQVFAEISNPEDLSFDSAEKTTSSLANKQREREKQKLAKMLLYAWEYQKQLLL